MLVMPVMVMMMLPVVPLMAPMLPGPWRLLFFPFVIITNVVPLFRWPRRLCCCRSDDNVLR